MRRILSAFILALFLLCGFSALAAEEMIYPQPVRITAMETGEYTLSFEGNLGENECWAWFVCPNEDSAEDLMEVMREAIADETPARGLNFDYVFSIWPIHGTQSIPSVKIPAGSGYVFYGKAYRGKHTFDREDELFMITLGGTNLSKIQPGDVGGNDLEDDDIVPPATGDSSNPYLLAILLVASVLGIAVLIKLNGKTEPVKNFL